MPRDAIYGLSLHKFSGPPPFEFQRIERLRLLVLRRLTGNMRKHWLPFAVIGLCAGMCAAEVVTYRDAQGRIVRTVTADRDGRTSGEPVVDLTAPQGSRVRRG